VIGKRSEGLLLKARPLEQAERISRSMAEVRVVVDALLLAADPAWAGAINTVLVKKGVRVSELRRTEGDDLRLTEGRNINGG
jgi:hypothetical protein